ncbi:mannose-6-phosphate isomerase [Amanita rubescens]|nr:mannose-6-phosphate isomerase [Amanita rubescens]
MTITVFKIVPTIQQYDWGKLGKKSKVSQFAESSVPGFTLDDAKPYAELWMGTHPKSPSTVASTNQILSEYLKENPSLMGEKIVNQFNAQDGNLPFLFKVLSIEKALSIQAHPNKKKAADLHAKQPDVYKDANHKPEMALALTPFRALCGWRPLPEVEAHIKATPELESLISPLVRRRFALLPDTSPTPSPFVGTGPAIAEAKQGLQDIFTCIMTKDEAEIKKQLEVLVQRYDKGEDIGGISQDLIDLVLRLNSQFPGDTGIFCVFLLNYVTLNPGEAIFLGAGEPHAYVEGEIIECMANSDNVVRAGLTPKPRDVPNLITTLTYSAAPPSKHVVEPVSFPDRSKSRTATSLLYDPPITEFSVIQIKLGSSEKETHRAIDGPSLFVVTTGEGKVTWGRDESLDLGLGDTVFIGASTPVEFISGGDGLVVYRSLVEIS